MCKIKFILEYQARKSYGKDFVDCLFSKCNINSDIEVADFYPEHIQEEEIKEWRQ